MACAAPLRTKHAPGSVCNVAPMTRSVLCAQAARLRKVKKHKLAEPVW